MNRRNRITLKSINQNNNNHSYFSGKGIWGGYDAHHHIIIRNNVVHDTPGSGIRFNDSDHITIENNTVYNTTWWTSSHQVQLCLQKLLRFRKRIIQMKSK